MIHILRGTLLVLGLCLLGTSSTFAQEKNDSGSRANLDYQVPNTHWLKPFKEQRPILFVNRNQGRPVWDGLKEYWNDGIEMAVDPHTGKPIKRKVVTIKVPLGLTASPPIPPENPMTVGKWKLGKALYFDEILSSNGTVACATCHDPNKGFTDQSPFSTGINDLKGGMSAPTVFNSAYNTLQFWDGRAKSLEDQAQGPVGNPVEMFAPGAGPGDDNHAWREAVLRVRDKPEYVKQFREVFGTEPTRDGIAKAIATYERTVLSGNSIHDRAQVAMLIRAEEEELLEFKINAKDYEKVINEAIANKDTAALEALQLDRAKATVVSEVAKSIANGRALFFGRARCNTCHAGDNFTDNQFHNLGVGVQDGKLSKDAMGRFASVPLGHKNSDLIGAFKTPTLRHLLGTAPYMHDGNEATLEKVVEFYDKGGNANEFLDSNMRDFEAEKAYHLSKRAGTEYKGPEVKFFGEDNKPIVPLKLNLKDQEKRDLVLFMRALQGDPPASIIADPDEMPE